MDDWNSAENRAAAMMGGQIGLKQGPAKTAWNDRVTNITICHALAVT